MATRRATLLSPQPKRLSTGLPRLSKDLRQGIQALDDFGFRTDTALTTSPRFSLYLSNSQEKQAKPLVHVTDFWTTRQQKEFLVKTGLRKAQFERERIERKEAMLQSKDKIETSHVNDQLYERILAEDDPLEAAKLYAAGPDGRLMKQLRNQLSCNSHRPIQQRASIGKSTSEPSVTAGKKRGTAIMFEKLLIRCDDTMKRNGASRQ
jgi:hypothetical protein